MAFFWRLGDWFTLLISFLFHPFSPPERLVDVKGTKVFVRRGTLDLFNVRQSLVHNDYQVEPRGVVFDLGANVGGFSLFAAKTASAVYAFEPDPDNFAQLQKNIAANGVENVVCVNAAVSGATGRADFHKARFNKASSSLVMEVSGNAVPVDVFSLKHAMGVAGVDHVDLLKVDIEGSEYELFEHADSETLGRIGLIAMETHVIPGKRVADIVARLDAAGFATSKRTTALSFMGMNYVYARRAPADMVA